jgi:hypothetical protein
VPADDLSGVMMGNPPLTVFANEQVARSQRAAVEFFLAQHQGDITVKEHLFIETGDPRGVGARQDSHPALHDCGPILQRGPSRVETRHRHLVGPEHLHSSEIPRGKSAVEFEIGREHGITIGHRLPRGFDR